MGQVVVHITMKGDEGLGSPLHVTPPGARSSCSRNGTVDDDYWNKWCEHDAFTREWRLLGRGKFDHEMSEPEQIDAKIVLSDLMQLGEGADLKFPSAWSSRSEVEADVIERHGNYLLELRHVPDNDKTSIFRRQQRAVRLYYYEPLEPERVLAALALGSKPSNSRDYYSDQDHTVDIAHMRAETWDLQYCDPSELERT